MSKQMKYFIICRKCYTPVTPNVPCGKCGGKRDIILRNGSSGWIDMRTTERYKRMKKRGRQRMLEMIRDEVRYSFLW